LWLYEIASCEGALQKVQRVDLDDDDPSNSSLIERLEKKIEHLQETIKNLTLRRNEVWCTTCCEDGHTKDTCIMNDQVLGAVDAWRVQEETYCNICETLTDHNVQDFSHKFKNTKWRHICEMKIHKTSECWLIAQNRNVKIVYHIEEIDQNSDYGRIIDYYGQGHGWGGHDWAKFQGQGQGQPYC